MILVNSYGSNGSMATAIYPCLSKSTVYTVHTVVSKLRLELQYRNILGTNLAGVSHELPN